LQVRFGVYLAAVYSDMGSNDRAQQVLREAGEIADEDTTSPPVRVSLFWGLASQAWDAADSDGALAYIRRAIGLLESSEDTYNLALAHLLAAQMTSLDGRVDEAGRHLERADRLFLLGADQSDVGILRAEQAIHAAALEQAEEAMARATGCIEGAGQHVTAYIDRGPVVECIVRRGLSGDFDKVLVGRKPGLHFVADLSDTLRRKPGVPIEVVT
jgi:tetratricopeptide (TPR) repeat protein